MSSASMRSGLALGVGARHERRATSRRGPRPSRPRCSVRAHDQHVLDRRAVARRPRRQACLSGTMPPLAPAAVGRDQHLARGVVDAARRATVREKPPNTTECAAPMRAQASIAIGSSGTMPHVDRDAVALCDAERRAARSRSAVDLVVQLAVGDRALVAGLADPDVARSCRRRRPRGAGRGSCTEAFSSPSANHL